MPVDRCEGFFRDHHDWTLWKVENVKRTQYDFNNGKMISYTTDVQTRKCERCGLMQTRDVW